MNPQEKLDALCARKGIKLPPPPQAVGVYQPMVVSGGFAFLSGQLSKDSEGKLITGKVGKDLTVEQARVAAEWAAFQALSVVRSKINLSRVKQIATVRGFVHCTSDFYQHSDVMNAASEILVEVFGDAGRHARTSVGVITLPLNAAVELELTLELQK